MSIPLLKKHASGRFFARFPDHCAGDGGRWSKYFGTDHEAAQVAYDSLVGEWLANGRSLEGLRDDAAPRLDVDPEDITVDDLVAIYWTRKVETTYRDQETGLPTSEMDVWRTATRYWLDEFTGRSVDSLTVVELEAWRFKLCRVVVNEETGRTMARTTVRRYVGKILKIIKWAAARDVIARDRALLCELDPLPKGAAKIPGRVKPVPEQLFLDTLEIVNDEVRDLLLLMRCTGMRPQEVCRICAREIDFAPLGMEGVWAFEPGRHKTEHHGIERVILLGPKAQEILRPRLAARGLSDNLFLNNKGGAWNSGTLGRYLARRLKIQDPPMPSWSPNQLRHSLATDARSSGSLDTAQSILGHSDVATTQNYAEQDRTKAADWIRKHG